MGLPDKSTMFEFLKDYKDYAKKGEVIQGYYADDWKDIEFRKMNSLGLVSKVFYAPMSEMDKTFKTTGDKMKPKPKPTPKDVADKLNAVKDKGEKAPDTKPTDDKKPTDSGTTPPVETKPSLFTTKNILIGVGVLVVLFVGVKMLRKKK
jgi:hypothetical protein